MKNTDITSATKVSPAPPLQIPQVEVQWTIPRAWMEFINANGVNVANAIDDFVTGWSGRISGFRIRDEFYEQFQRLAIEHGNQVAEAMQGETDYLRTILNRELWGLVVEAASNLGDSPQSVMLVILARNLKFHDELSTAGSALAAKTATSRAAKTPPLHKIMAGPWVKKNRPNSKFLPTS